ncbi:Arylsulfatase A [Neorhodopirellula lusitana]|uniref:Arylsulfatase A n=1 Tax=Neorhodopirellula lusitana TaxID=445327 RepID=A0ABY1QS62_9BACT|nr:arylsulfatase [Neorhodopirellula lusitana]SMP78886.1 Arylsulfatase A [Neorhodopirellula lusitana]
MVRLILCFSLAFLSCDIVRAEKPPNIVFVLADDLAQGDLGSYGQKLIQTPNLDRMAAEGTRYTQAYAGSSVCAPSRSSLMTGLHMGHCPVRGNYPLKTGSRFGAGQLPLPASTLTVAQLLKSSGYATACMGKWGMGQFDTTGSPHKKGFDHFFGYNGQAHAHSYFPTYLHDDESRIELPENKNDAKQVYADKLIQNNMLQWVGEQGSKPFFLFYATTLPHGKYEIDDLGIYAKYKEWSPKERAYAAMVTRLDSDMGQLFGLLKQMGIDQDTLVLFVGDNGSSFSPTSEIGKRFDQSMGGTLRGFKRSMYEGGLRQPAIARWPGKVPAGRVSDEPWAFWDFLPTAAELANVTLPSDTTFDGLSLVSFLKGGPAPTRDYFYWELHEREPKQAIRFGDWKAVRNRIGSPLELYNLESDASESHDVADQNPELIAKAAKLMNEARVENEHFPWRPKN